MNEMDKVRCPKCGRFFFENEAKPDEDYWVKCPHCDGYISLPQTHTVGEIFNEYEEENPDWKEHITDSTFNDIMDWYVNELWPCDEEVKSEYKEEAYEFATCVWNELIEKK